jgi:hypothetical protein
MLKIKTYKDFLNNNDFIIWQITKDEDLYIYWSNYLTENEEEREEFEKAIHHFSRFRMNKTTLSDKDYLELLKKIHSNITLSRINDLN